MAETRVAVYTAVTSNYDNLLAPRIKVPGWSYLCFTDDGSRARPGWEIRPLPRNGLDPIRLSRLPKILPHRFLQDYDASIYIDANIAIKGDLTEFCTTALADANIAFFRHGCHRRSVAREIYACFRARKASLTHMISQYLCYRDQGFPDDKGIIPESGIIVRRHNDPSVRIAMEQWWSEIQRHTARDQISLPYIIWRNSMNVALLDWDLRQTPWFDYRYHGR